jgi:ABC-2 type transport system permease protein
MLRLILKEFQIQRKTLLYSFLYVIMAAVAFTASSPNGSGLYILGPFGVIYLFVMYSCGYEDKNRTDIIFNSLPLKREDIVIAKYLSIFLFAALGLVLAFIIGILGVSIGFESISRLITTNDIIAVLGSGMIFASIFYPLYLKFGLVKMRVLNIFLFLFLMFVPNFVLQYAESHSEKTIVKSVMNFILNSSEWALQVVFLIICSILYLLSLLISLKVYRNKEF